VDEWECERANRIKKIQGNANQILQKQCLWKKCYLIIMTIS
jgi:endonuclease I